MKTLFVLSIVLLTACTTIQQNAIDACANGNIDKYSERSGRDSVMVECRHESN